MKHLKIMDERVGRYESSLSVDDADALTELMTFCQETKFEASPGASIWAGRFMVRANVNATDPPSSLALGSC